MGSSIAWKVTAGVRFRKEQMVGRGVTEVAFKEQMIYKNEIQERIAFENMRNKRGLR